jgi:hypothetical protein
VAHFVAHFVTQGRYSLRQFVGDHG